MCCFFLPIYVIGWPVLFGCLKCIRNDWYKHKKLSPTNIRIYKKECYTLLPNNDLTSLTESNTEQFKTLYSQQDNVVTVIIKFNISRFNF